MSIQSFTAGTENAFLAQPDGAGEALYTRSDDAGDTMDISIYGADAGTSPQSETLTLAGLLEVPTSDATWAELTQILLDSVATGNVTVYGPGTAATGLVHVETQPSNNDTFRVGVGSNYVTYTFKTALTPAANEILIGASAAATAENLRRALNDDGVAGTNYGTGTTVNPYVSASNVGSILTLTDRIACARAQAWILTQTVGSTLGIGGMLHGVDGEALAIIQAGDERVHDPLSTDNEDLASLNLPPNFTFISDWVQVSGRRCMFVLDVGAYSGSNLSVDYEHSTAPANNNPRASDGGPFSLAAGTENYAINPAESAMERVRLTVVNPNAFAIALNAKLVTGN